MPIHTGKVKLEVATSQPNLLRNPYVNSNAGVWAWLTPLAGSKLTKTTDGGVNDVLQYQQNVTQAAYFTSEYIPATAGKYYNAKVLFATSSGSVGFKMSFEFYQDSTGSSKTLISSSTLGSLNTTTGTSYTYTPALAPALTAFVKFRIDVFTSAGANLPAFSTATFRSMAVVEGATSGAVTTPTVTDTYVWTDIVGPGTDITITRGSLDVGTLTATLLDANLDPLRATTIGAGKPVRIRADSTGVGTYENLWVGRIKTWNTDYSDSKGKPLTAKGATKVTFTATDAIDLLNSAKEPRGVATVAEMAEILEGKGMAWKLNGSSDGVYSITQIRTDPEATALDQVALVKDSLGGYAWVNKDNTLVMYDRASLPTGVAATFSDSTSLSFTEISPATDSQDIINSVTINYLRYDAGTKETKSVVYGPYVNTTSIQLYGTFDKTYTIQFATEDPTTIATYANAILTANAYPVLKVGGLTLRVKTQADMTKAIQLDLLHRIHVNLSTIVNQDVLIDSVTHRITPDAWFVDYGFTPVTTYETPTVSVLTGGGGMNDTVSATDYPVSGVGWGMVGVLSGFTYGTGWAAWSDTTNEGNGGAIIKKVGTKVTLRGLFRRTSGAGNVMLQIPAAYYPTRTTYRPCIVNSAASACAVGNTGQVTMVTAYTTNQFVAIDLTWDTDQP